MASLTPLSKGLIAVTIISGFGAAAWKLGLKDLIHKAASNKPEIAERHNDETQGAATTTPTANHGATGPLGSVDNPLKVSLVSFHGYAPALVANGNSLATKPGSIYASANLHVQFVIQDDIPTLTTIFTSKAAQCAWRTSDFWAQEQPNLRNAGLDGRAVMIVDNTQGADAIIAKDPAIQRVEDLADHSIALLQFTPSHGMTIDAIENSSLSARKAQSVKYVFINADDGTAGVRAAFTGGKVDAAALWDPDLSLAIKAVPGAHVVYSTKTATNLIYDVIVCDKRVLDDPTNTPVIQAFVKGWMDGVKAAKANPETAVDALGNTEEFFALLIKDQGRAFTRKLFDNLAWTGLDDNIRIFGMAGGTNHYERVYQRFDGIYREAGALANPKSPVIPPQQSVDYSFINNLMAAAPEARVEAKKPEYTFTATEAAAVAEKPAVLTKPVSVTFATSEATLNKRAEHTIDKEMVPLIESNGSAYFEVSGNTDSTGNRGVNQKISLQRAQSVVDYLVKQWDFERNRFKVIGYGSDRPLCNESNPEDGASLDDCRAQNRATRLAVLSRR